jgi:hypothetical protein
MGFIAGHIDTLLKEWKVNIGDYVVPEDLICVVTFENYAGTIERNIKSDIYGTVSEKYYSEGEIVPKKAALWGAKIDTRYYMDHFSSLMDMKGESGLEHYLELMCKLSMPDNDKYNKEKWIKELSEWTDNMKNLFQTCKMDLYKTANIICDKINDDIFDMYEYYTIQSFNHAIERGKIKDIPKDIHLDVSSYIFPKLVHSFTDYCRMFWITGSGEEKESTEAGIRRIYDDILKI